MFYSFVLLLHRLAVRISLPFYDFLQVIIVLILACVVSVSVRFAPREQRRRNESQRPREKWRKKKGSCFISRAAKTENPVPRSFFAPKPNGNACHAGYIDPGLQLKIRYQLTVCRYGLADILHALHAYSPSFLATAH